MDYTDKFINQWKELERVSKLLGYNAIIDLEQGLLDQEDRKKMQLCRVTRNYLQHHSERFTEPTKEMYLWLKEFTAGLAKSLKSASDCLVRVTPVPVKTKYAEVAGKLSEKRPQLPVVDTNNCVVGLLTAQTVCKAVAAKTVNRAIDVKLLEKVPEYVKPSDLMEDIEGFAVVTADGTQKGKYKGIIYAD